ncbi:MAG: hypothetical protein HQL37_15265, partial [Alphaproteobacteria bacterium]|nr:hypothetical protein [Alphaproteobacteria bacterium]
LLAMQQVTAEMREKRSWALSVADRVGTLPAGADILLVGRNYEIMTVILKYDLWRLHPNQPPINIVVPPSKDGPEFDRFLREALYNPRISHVALLWDSHHHLEDLLHLDSKGRDRLLEKRHGNWQDRVETAGSQDEQG